MNDRLMRRQEVEEVTGLGHSTIYRKMDDGTFPQSVKVTSRSVRWRESDIEAWMESLPVTGVGPAGDGASDGKTRGARHVGHRMRRDAQPRAGTSRRTSASRRPGMAGETSIDSLRADMLGIETRRARRPPRRPRKLPVQDRRGAPARPATGQPPSEDCSVR